MEGLLGGLWGNVIGIHGAVLVALPVLTGGVWRKHQFTINKHQMEAGFSAAGAGTCGCTLAQLRGAIAPLPQQLK